MKLVCAVVAVLFVVRLIVQPVIGGEQTAVLEQPATDVGQPSAEVEQPSADTCKTSSTEQLLAPTEQSPASQERAALDFSYTHRLRGVHSYKECFPDVQDTHYVAAITHGVSPVKNRIEAEQRKSELVYIGSNPFYEIDSAMRSSIPYLVPRASVLLHDIGRRFLDSLAVKGIPLHTIIVTSVLRTEEDVASLRRINGNASEQSCHRFGTTFDISYNRYHTMTPPDEEQRRAVRNDTLKFVLSEVLRDLRDAGRCYVKHEVKQGCFHITTR